MHKEKRENIERNESVNKHINTPGYARVNDQSTVDKQMNTCPSIKAKRITELFKQTPKHHN